MLAEGGAGFLLACTIIAVAGLGFGFVFWARMRASHTARLRAEMRLASFADSTSQWLWESDAENRFTYLSRVPGGMTPEFVIGRRRDEFADPGDAQAWQAHLAVLAARQPFDEFTYTTHVPDGSVRVFSTSGRPVFDERGEFRGYRGTGRDVSREFAARADAARAERRLTEALENVSLGFALFDTADRLAICNAEFRKHYGSIAERLRIGMTFTELTRETVDSGQVRGTEGRPEAWAAERVAHHQAAAGTIEIALVDGRRLLVSEHRTSDGGIALVQTDVTALKAREAELDAKSKLLAAIVDGIAEGLVAIDTDEKILVWNERFEELFDYPKEIMQVGGPFLEMLRFNARRGDYGPGDPEKVAAARLHVVRTAETNGTEWRRADGSILEVRRRHLDTGGWVSTFFDVTERKRAERALQTAKEQAEMANRAKTNFLANMSHELRTPLNAIIGFSEIVKDELLGPIGTRRYLDYINDIHMSGSHLLEVINDILDLSKVESGRFELLEKGVDISRAVTSTLRLVRDKAAQGQVVLETAMPTPAPSLIADERALKQILINLVSNAVKFTRAGGRVQIRVELPDTGEMLLVVEDTGIGINAADLPKALAPFGQVDSTLTRKYQGTGLGLPLVKSLSELHGGTLELVSTPGVGTRATVRMPARRVMPLAPVERRAQKN